MTSLISHNTAVISQVGKLIETAKKHVDYNTQSKNRPFTNKKPADTGQGRISHAKKDTRYPVGFVPHHCQVRVYFVRVKLTINAAHHAAFRVGGLPLPNSCYTKLSFLCLLFLRGGPWGAFGRPLGCPAVFARSCGRASSVRGV